MIPGEDATDIEKDGRVEKCIDDVLETVFFCADAEPSRGDTGVNVVFTHVRRPQFNPARALSQRHSPIIPRKRIPNDKATQDVIRSDHADDTQCKERQTHAECQKVVVIDEIALLGPFEGFAGGAARKTR